jgi:hypothetical protein
MVYFKVLPQNLTAETEEKKESLRDGSRSEVGTRT